MDFPYQMESEISVFPKDVEYKSESPQGNVGFQWTAKYGSVGVCTFGIDKPVYGVNTEGLSCGFLTLNTSKYQDVPDYEQEKAIELFDLLLWMLGSFETVAEVKNQIGNVLVWAKYRDVIKETPLLHIAVHDADGNNLVIEYINGTLSCVDHPLGVLTNDPELSWHMKNLKRYNGVSNVSPPAVTINGAEIHSGGIGSGTSQIPGGYASQDRFIRVAKMIQLSEIPYSYGTGVSLASKILGTVTIPRGVVVVKEDGPNSVYETTRWTAIQVLQKSHVKFFYNSSYDPTYKVIHLNNLDFNPDSYSKKKLRIQSEGVTSVNVTDEFYEK
jgi:choloylglycine hydrolase